MNKFIIKNENDQNTLSVESNIDEISSQLTEDTELNTEITVNNHIENTYTINGLNLLCDPKKKKNMTLKTNINDLDIDLKSFDLNVEEFKKFFKKKIENFDILNQRDIYDNLILSGYYHFIFSKINQDKLISFVKENSIN